jgi:hypothetical protein
MDMRSIAVPAVVIALLLAACGSSSGGGGAPAPGTLSGRVGISGGAANPSTGTGLVNAPAQGATVTATAAGDHQYTATTDDTGNYTLSLPAGTYTLKTECGPAARVVVTAAQTTVHDVHCDVP